MPTLLIVLATLASDQLTKFIILKNFLPGDSYPIIKNSFHLSLVFNQGFAFGMLSGAPSLIWILIYSLAIGIIIFIFLFYRNSFACSKSAQVAFSLILGGALGNLIDRVRFGYVVDFLDFRIWPVFNIADSAITIGTILVILHLLKRKHLQK